MIKSKTTAVEILWYPFFGMDERIRELAAYRPHGPHEYVEVWSWNVVSRIIHYTCTSDLRQKAKMLYHTSLVDCW